VTDVDLDAGPEPYLFDATTVTVYVVPLVSPVIVQVRAVPVVLQVNGPGSAVAT
jgi:hypothetical protein